MYNLQLLFFGKNVVHYFIINFWHITECLLCYKAETKDKEMTFSMWILWECRDASCIVWKLSLSLTYLQENILPWVKCKCWLICNDNRESVLNYVRYISYHDTCHVGNCIQSNPVIMKLVYMTSRLLLQIFCGTNLIPHF